MTTDNVLVSREWLESLLGIIELIADGELLATNSEVKASCRIALSMPDFIESERDVAVSAEAIFKEQNDYKLWKPYKKYFERLAQAAINALRYRKEGE